MLRESAGIARSISAAIFGRPCVILKNQVSATRLSTLINVYLFAGLSARRLAIAYTWVERIRGLVCTEFPSGFSEPLGLAFVLDLPNFLDVSMSIFARVFDTLGRPAATGGYVGHC
jgi:hypothetical protein